MKFKFIVLVATLVLMCSAGYSPDREYPDNYYLYFDNQVKDGICNFKINMTEIPVDSIEKYQSKGKEMFPVIRLPHLSNVPYCAIYDGSSKRYFGFPLPFSHGNRVSSIGINNIDSVDNKKRSTYLIEGHERIYGSGGGTATGGTLLISYEDGTDYIKVHLKIIDYKSEEVFGRNGAKYSYQEYTRPLLAENGKLFILPIDSNQLPNDYNQCGFTPINVGVYQMEDDYLTMTSKIEIH